MKAGVVSRTDIPEAITVAKEILKNLESLSVDVLVETDTALVLNTPERNTDLGEMDVDFIVTVGGDGTILRAAMLMHDPKTPILGVNLGRRGFLTEVTPSEVKLALSRILEGNYRLEECVKLSSRSPGHNGTLPDSLNEVLVASSLPSKILDLSLSVDGEHIIDIQADGVIIATPTGSTAYSLSAGGSIIAPDVPAMIITTICPYSYFRSLVAPLTSRVSIELLKPKADALAIIDGRSHTALKSRSFVEVWTSPHRAKFIRFRSFYDRLKRRLAFQRIKDLEDRLHQS